MRTRAVQLLVDLAQTCESVKFTDILKILEKVNREYHNKARNYCNVWK